MPPENLSPRPPSLKGAGGIGFLTLEQAVPRFVILEHDFPEPHFDLMLEDGDALRTWRLPAMPGIGKILFAPELPRHRLLYLDYEGPVSGDRGSVVRRASGSYNTIPWPDGTFLLELTHCDEPMTLHVKPVDDGWRFFCAYYFDYLSPASTTS